MSASFGETRSSHFHAAIDMKTWGRIGFELYATRDGILHRVARSPFGYGNVIYLKHDDGSYSVYAHMHRFTTKIDALVDSLRWEQRVFVFDQNMEKYGIRFKKGQLVG
ncbi:M23 family metallopeptidase, partial [Nodularia spumigena CH309]|nr:M23 family metallopeptidase [Nodularia spumigena CH309]